MVFMQSLNSRKLMPGILFTLSLVTVAAQVCTPLYAAVLPDGKPLSLSQAETLAISDDPSIDSVRSRQAALSELEVAAAQLPDPMLKMGVMSLPTDSFQLGQEPMTQVQLGLVQKFPRGDTRELRAAQLRERARGLDEAATDMGMRIILSVREEFIEVLTQQRLAAINADAEAAFGDLEEITQDYYATGRAQQQDVLRTAVEYSKVRERSFRIAEEEDRARARLAAWIGEFAWRPLAGGWPDLPAVMQPEPAREALENHPRLRALHQQVIAADKGVALAEQAYKPEFSVDLTYGGRGGNNPDGSNRPDLLSLMVLMDVPLFREKRQDRMVSASIAESSAAAFDRNDIYRRMYSELQMQQATFKRQRERLQLFEAALLKDADFNAEAAYQAYQAALEDMTTLMRASITQYDLQLEYVRLQAEARKTQARLAYLQGGDS